MSARWRKTHLAFALTLLRIMGLSAPVFAPAWAHAADVPQSFTLDGKLYSNSSSTTALVDSNIVMKLQILDEDRTCILYEEQQSVSTLATSGYFTVQVGSNTGDAKRTAGDVGNTMPQVFQNLNSVNGKKPSDGTACTVSATGGKRRYVRMTITPSTMGGTPRTLSPDLSIDSVPNAVVAERAETLQGYRSSDMLKVNTLSGNVLSQTNLESLFSSTARFNALTAVVDGTSTSYMRSNSPSGAQLPVIAGAPTSPGQGAVWYDSSDNTVKYRTGVGTTQTLANAGGAGTGTVTSVDVAAPTNEFTVSGGPVTASGTITLSWKTQTANLVFAGPASGGAAAPGFRALVAADIPALDWSKIGSGTPTTLAGYGVTDAVRNVTGTPSITTGLDAAKGAGGTVGRLYIASDTKLIYRDNGATWDQIGGGGAPTGAASGDLSGTYPGPTVAKIQGVSVSATAPTAGQVLKNVASVWTPVNFGAGDLLTAAGATQFGSASCAASQTLTWSSLTGAFTCSNIAGLDAGVLTTGTVASARLGSGTADGTTFLRGDGTWAVPSGTSSLPAAAGTAAAPGYAFSGDTNTGMFGAAADTIGFSTNSTERVRIDSSGNVGIGTTNPLYKLEVNGTVNTGALTATSLSTSSNLWANTIYPYNSAAPLTVYGGIPTASGNTVVITGSSSQSNASGQKTILAITPTYNQSGGSGSNTDLLINRTESAVGSGQQNLIDAQVGGVSKFRVDNTGKVYGDGSGLTGITAAPSGTIGQVQFNSGSGTMAASSSLYWDNTSKYLGIGTSSPGAQLNVKGTAEQVIQIESTGAGNHADLILKPGVGGRAFVSSATAGSSIYFSDGGGGYQMQVDTTHAGVSIGSGAGYAQTADSAPANGMIVQGNVGIGTTTPGALLQLGTAGTSLGTMRMAGSTSGYVQVQPAAAAGSWTMTLPASAGTSGYVLQTDGAGVTSWVAQAGGASSGTAGYIQFSNGSGGFSSDTSQLFWDSTNNRLGIGTASPLSPLHIENNQASATVAIVSNPSTDPSAQSAFTAMSGAAYASFGIRSSGHTDANSAFIWNAANTDIIFATNNAEKMRMKSDGSIGLGNSNPSSILDVSGALTQRGMAAPAASVAGQGRIYFDSTANKFKVSENNGAYVDLVGSGGAPTGAAGGDLSGTYPNPGVAKIQGVSVSATAPTAGQVLKNVASVWTPVNFGVGDLLTSAGATQFGSASCTAAQTLTWSALTGAFTCSNIAGLDAGVLTTGTVASARLGSGTADGTTFLRGDGTWAVPSGTTQWTTSGSHIYYNTGNVAIGSNSPTATTRLEVVAGGAGFTTAALKNDPGAAGANILQLENTRGASNLSNAISFRGNTTDKFVLGNDYALNGGQNFYLYDAANSTMRLLVDANGNVGIGASAPGAKLDVTGSANAIAIQSTGHSLTGANAQSLMNLSGTWNTTGTPTLIKANVTDTASNASSLLMDLQVGGVSKFKVDKTGKVTGDGSGLTGISGAISGLTTGYLPKATSATAIGDSLLFENGTGIGIGTTSPAAGLEIKRNAAASTPIERLSGTWFSGGTATTTKPSLLIEPTGTTTTSWSTSGTGLGVNAPNAFTGNLADFQVNGVSQASVNAYGVINGNGMILGSDAYISGNVGVGNMAPGAKLDVTSAANAIAIQSTGYSLTAANAQSLMNLTGTWNTTGTPTLINANVTDTASNAASLLMDLQVGGVSKFKVDKTGKVTGDGSGLTGVTPSFSGLSSTGLMYASSATATTSTLSTDMAWDNTNKRLGIGTATPTDTLDVNGNIMVSGSNRSITLNSGQFAGSNSASVSWPTYSFYNDADSGFTQIGGAVNTASIVTGGVERIRIDTSGNVGIGTTAPSTILDINGGFTVRGLASAPTAAAGQGKIYYDSTANKFKVSENNGAYVDLVGGGGGGVSGSGTTGKIPKFSGASALGDSLMTEGTGRITVAGQLVAAATTDQTSNSPNISFNNGNSLFVSANCGAFSLSNMVDGGSYQLTVKGTTGSCTFSHGADTVRYAGGVTSVPITSHTVFAFSKMGGDVYVTWVNF